MLTIHFLGCAEKGGETVAQFEIITLGKRTLFEQTADRVEQTIQSIKQMVITMSEMNRMDRVNSLNNKITVLEQGLQCLNQ